MTAARFAALALLGVALLVALLGADCPPATPAAWDGEAGAWY